MANGEAAGNTHSCRLYRDSSISPCLMASTVSCGLSICILASYQGQSVSMLHNIDGIIIQHTVMIFFVSGGATVSPPDALRFPGFEASRTGILEGIVKDREMKALPSKQDFPTGDCRERREDEGCRPQLPGCVQRERRGSRRSGQVLLKEQILPIKRIIE